MVGESFVMMGIGLFSNEIVTRMSLGELAGQSRWQTLYEIAMNEWTTLIMLGSAFVLYTHYVNGLDWTDACCGNYF